MDKNDILKLLPNEDPLDAEGYPTEEYLEFIRNFHPREIPYSVFLAVLQDGWNFSEWGFVLHRKYRNIQKLVLHTGGWSGNEEIIEAIKSNIFLTHFTMKYCMWKIGGHYYFEIKTDAENF